MPAGSRRLIYKEPSFDFIRYCNCFFLAIMFPSYSRFSVRYYSALLRAFVSRSSKRLFSFHFTGKHCFHSGAVDFLLLTRFLRQDSVGGIPRTC